jgi:hypothetical protein
MTKATKNPYTPGSLKHLVLELGTAHPDMTAEEIHKRVTRQTLLSIRSKVGVTNNKKSSRKPAVAAAPTNGHSPAPARAPDAHMEFRKLVARIGTDAAERLLEAARKMEL